MADQYRAPLIEAVKFAEKAIPDDTPSKGARRADEALQYFLKLVGAVDERAARQALTVVHSELEASGNL